MVAIPLGQNIQMSATFASISGLAVRPFQLMQESEAIAALENCLCEHADEYVRLFSIDTRNKCRAHEIVIQRPNGKNKLRLNIPD